jgi:PAS domain S-box-containing protein
MPVAPSPYFFLSFSGAVGFAILLGVVWPRLLLLIIRNVSWAKPGRSARVLLATWLFGAGFAWGFDAYCQWFGLVNELSVMLFLNLLAAITATVYGYRNYRRLNNIVTLDYFQQEQRLLRTVQRVSHDGFFVSRPTDNGWQIQSANRAACRILGYEFRTLFDNELIGVRGLDLIPEEMREKAIKFVQTSGRVDYMLQFLHKDASRRWVEISAETIPDYHGAPARVSCFTDVTIHMLKNQDLTDQLRTAQLLKTLEQNVNRLTNAPAL